jgi:hypothetical protein
VFSRCFNLVLTGPGHVSAVIRNLITSPAVPAET